MRRQFALILVAVQFLTRLPVPRIEGFTPNWLGPSVRYFGLVGVLIGLIGVGVWWLIGLLFPPNMAVGAMIAATLLLTGALHEDGFADVCDGFGGGKTPDAVLAIMKDSRIGAYGAIGIGMMLALKWTALVSLPRSALLVTAVGAHMISRWCAVGLIWRLPYVRTGVDAKSNSFAASVSAGNWLFCGVLGIVGLLPIIFLDHPAGLEGPAPMLLPTLALALAGTALAGIYFKIRLGGYTGDCLGAAQQSAELIVVMGMLGFLRVFQ
jgi:adenosylcobinamide-GDP ribazoletransferase